MSLAVNMGRWQLGTLVLSRRRAMRRLRLANCWRILGFTRNPSGRKRGHGLHNHETPEKAEGFRVFQEPCWAGGENLACVRPSTPKTGCICLECSEEMTEMAENKALFSFFPNALMASNKAEDHWYRIFVMWYLVGMQLLCVVMLTLSVRKERQSAAKRDAEPSR